MVNIVIFSGGTRSIALQTGLHKIYGDKIKTDIIISAYDNGKSTGECRKVFNSRILGPSDLRKNQLTQYQLIYKIEDKNEKGVTDEWTLFFNLFNIRFSLSNWQEAYDYSKKEIEDSFNSIYEKVGNNKHSWEEKQKVLDSLLDYFFFMPYLGGEGKEKIRNSILTTNFTDFSISNMFYAAAAALYGNSLGLAGKLMSLILDIPDNVHLISDVNLYLHARTINDSVIGDEGDIVTWNNDRDRIVDISLLNEEGKEYIPSIDENNMTDVSCAGFVRDADIIIFSSGTQWSSLIPTYVHKGLNKVLSESHAKKYLVMNNIEDADMKGINAEALLHTVEHYLNLDDVSIIINRNAVDSLSKLNDDTKFKPIYGELSVKGQKKHDPIKIASIILRDYYKDFLNTSYYFFDFDDTIWSSSKEQFLRDVSKDNLILLYKTFYDDSIIISGNSSNHFVALAGEFKEAQDAAEAKDTKITIYCNGGNCLYHIDHGDFVYERNLVNDYNLNEDYTKLGKAIVKALNENGWVVNMGNFENRGNCIMSIKPLKRREQARDVIMNVIKKVFGFDKYTPYINGNTTIDIMNTQYNKRMCVRYAAKKLGLPLDQITYIGDKFDGGNDACLIDIGIKVLSVNDAVDFNCFARTAIVNKQIQEEVN